MKNLFLKYSIALFLGVVCLFSCKQTIQPGSNEELWYTYPAKYWNSQALHLGNGYMGASFMGGIKKEVIALSEKSMWTGGPFRGDWEEVGVNPKCREMLPEIRKLVVTGNIQKADEMVMKYYIGDDKRFGDFTSIGNLEIEFDIDSVRYTGYRRYLDLSRAVGGVTFQSNGINYTREYFCSYPDRVFGIRLMADKSKALNFSMGMEIVQDSFRTVITGNLYELQGFINGNLRPFNVMIRIETDGTLETIAGRKLIVKNANQAVLWVSAATNYAMKYPDYIGEDPTVINKRLIENVAGKSFDEVKNIHIKDYRALYSRVEFHLAGNEKVETLPTNQRWLRFAKGEADPGLKEMAFNLGRYLIISSSRPGTLPANLQGVWNVFKRAPWAGNYQSNINLQEIYWSCGPTALPECQEAYIDWIRDLSVWGKEIAKRCYGTDGWVSHTTGNIWGHAAPIGGLSWGVFPAAAAWHCQHVWEQFAFGQDTAYLRLIAYPLMKGAATFYIQNLISYKGNLILSPAVSAEHGAVLKGGVLIPASESGDGQQFNYNIPGTTQDAEMIRDLFVNTIAASEILKIDTDFRKQLAEKKDQLLPLRTGKYGQLQEWAEDIDDSSCHHRHIAHLYAVYPGKEIHPLITPELANAAKKSLDMRGDGRFLSDDPASGGNWSMAHRMMCWARLLDGNRADKIFTRLLVDQGFENLCTYQQAEYHWERKDLYMEGDSLYCHFQLDASAAIPGFIAELLLQSQLGEIDLLPALPDRWKEGSVKGLKARGGYIVDLSWKEGKLVKATILSNSGKIPVIRLQSEITDLKNNEQIKLIFR